MKNSTGAEIKDDSSSEYQQRYLAHQSLPGGKRDELIRIMKERHSNRRYADTDVPQEVLDSILDLCRHAPSSCDRFGTRIKIIRERDDKALLNGLLVGGTGWCYRAPIILMLFADSAAYKGGDNGDEVEYNSFLDAGVMAQQIMLTATANDLHVAFINPQVRKNNREFFYSRFTPVGWDTPVFCGAVAIGYPHPEAIEKTRKLIESVVVE